MSVDRILQLKLVADVSDINKNIGSEASGAIGKVGQLKAKFEDLRKWGLAFGATMAFNLLGALMSQLSEAAERAQTLKRAFYTLDGITASLDIDTTSAETAISGLVMQAQELGTGQEADIVPAFTQALSVTESVEDASAIVQATYDDMARSGDDFETSFERTMDALVGGGDEAEEKLGVVGETFEERLASFNEKYGNLAEEFAQTDLGRNQQMKNDAQGLVDDLGAIWDDWSTWFLAGVANLPVVWGENIAQLGVIWNALWTRAAEWVQSKMDAVAETISGAFNHIVELIRDALNTIIDGWNSLGIPAGSIGIGPVQHSWDDWTVPQIPRLAEGGIVTKPTLAMIGEAGAEAVVPLDRGGMGNTYHINFNGVTGDPAEAGRKVVEVIRRYESRAGRGWRS